MRFLLKAFLALLLATPTTGALADDYAGTVKVFKDAGVSGAFFDTAYGYALFPTIGKVVSVSAAHMAKDAYMPAGNMSATSNTASVTSRAASSKGGGKGRKK